MINKIKSTGNFLQKKVLNKKLFNRQTLALDLIAGISVALILIPQSLAYAQLAGLPAHYGLYASFLPLVVGALFGSSRFLATGPVAMVSLITSSVLGSLSVTNKSELIAYAILLSLLVGLIQFILGTLKLGVIVNFISHPVIIGFTNAAALIIATSQLPKVFGVSVDTYEHHYETMYHFFLSITKYVHWLSVGMALLAFTVIYVLKKFAPKIPAILVAVVVCTILSYWIGYEQKLVITSPMIISVELNESIKSYNELLTTAQKKIGEKNLLIKARKDLQTNKTYGLPLLELENRISKIEFEYKELEHQIQSYRNLIHSAELSTGANNDKTYYYEANNAPLWYTHNDIWKIHIGEGPINPEKIIITTGSSVVGKIPAGLPTLSVPSIAVSSLPTLFNAALIIAILGFMESIAVARSLAIKVGDRIDPNRELVGQGLANIVGAFSQSYPVAGSFSRTAVNFNAGAKTVFSSVFTAIFVLLTLLFLTPLLYHLPQPVLAIIIISSVLGLINFEKVKAAWRTNRNDGITAIVTFAATLFYAPHLDKGIILGILISAIYYIYTRTRPRIIELSADENNILHDIKLYRLRPCKSLSILRFDGSLFFANAGYLEDRLNRIIQTQTTKGVVLLADGINYIDFSGIEILGLIAKRFNEENKIFIVAQMKTHILNVIKKTPEFLEIGEDNFIRDEYEAVRKAHTRTHLNSHEKNCPLNGLII